MVKVAIYLLVDFGEEVYCRLFRQGYGCSEDSLATSDPYGMEVGTHDECDQREDIFVGVSDVAQDELCGRECWKFGVSDARVDYVESVVLNFKRQGTFEEGVQFSFCVCDGA